MRTVDLLLRMPHMCFNEYFKKFDLADLLSMAGHSQGIVLNDESHGSITYSCVTLERFERLRNNKDLDRERRRRQNCKTTMPLQRYRETKIQQLMNLHYLFLDKIKYQLVIYKHCLD